MIYKTALSAAFLLASISAQAACPVLAANVTVAAGMTAHVTPTDQNCAPIPINQCTFGVTLPSAVATWTKDPTGFVITGVANSYAGVRISCSDGVNPAVPSNAFTVTVTPPPYPVTAVGSVVSVP